MCRRVCTLDGLDIQVENTCEFSLGCRARREIRGGSTPSCSRTVAYRELARGHDCRLQNPVTLYSFRQKFCVTVLGKATLELRADEKSGV
jgi:hypothetical protein